MINIQIQKKDLWLLAAIMIFLAGVTYVIAYNPSGTGGNPAIMGHSVDEIETCPNGKILKTVSGSWQCSDDLQGSGSGGLPLGCSNNQVAKWNGTAWICASDIDTDTKCNTAGSCSQVCIGTSCKSSWPASAICTWSGVTYSTGASCEVECVTPIGANGCGGYTCQSDGSWNWGSCGTMDTPPCSNPCA